MSRHTRTALFAAAALFLPAAALAPTALVPIALAQEASTTRIETRAFYGATVTLEAGVRVFRPLPPHSKVIINPGGVTPLHVGQEEYRATTRNYNYNYDQQGNGGDPGPGPSGSGSSYGGPAFGGVPFRARRAGDGRQPNGARFNRGQTGGAPVHFTNVPPIQPKPSHPAGGGGKH